MGPKKSFYFSQGGPYRIETDRVANINFLACHAHCAPRSLDRANEIIIPYF